MSQAELPPPARFQFPLRYLIYLLTLFALGFAIFRRIVGLHGGWQLNTVMSIYLAVFFCYFAFRFPILVARFWRRYTAGQMRRRELARLLEQARQQSETDKRAGEGG